MGVKVKHIVCALALVLGVSSVSIAQVYDFNDPSNLGVTVDGGAEWRSTDGNGYFSEVLAGNGVVLRFSSPVTVHALNFTPQTSPESLKPAYNRPVSVSFSGGGQLIWYTFLDGVSNDWYNWQTAIFNDIAGVDTIAISGMSAALIDGGNEFTYVSVDNVVTVDPITPPTRASGKLCKDSPGKGRGVPGGKACMP